MKLKAMKWIADHNGEIIKRTLIGAGSIIGLALLSGLTVNPAEDFTEYDGEAENCGDGEQTIEVESEEITPEETTEG